MLSARLLESPAAGLQLVRRVRHVLTSLMVSEAQFEGWTMEDHEREMEDLRAEFDKLKQRFASRNACVFLAP